MELGWPLPKRREFLKTKLAEKSTKTHPVPFQGKMHYVAIHSVPIGLPLYRLENGRTTGRQAEYLSANPNVPKDFFRSDTESAAAQKAQHKILVDLTRERKNLFKEFETNPQIEPLVLTSLGYVVNGNRRLSTLRVLFESDKKKFSRFRNVDVLVLPHADEKEIDYVEAELQLKEDLKADYSWTSTALMMREKTTRYKYNEEELATLYSRDKKDVVELLDCLDYAVQYLEARDITNKFSEVDAKEYAFIQIVRTRKKWKASEAAKELFEKASFCLTDEAGEGKRVYAEIPKVADHLDKVVEDLTTELEIDIGDHADEDATMLRVSEVISEKDNFERARVVIRDAIEAASFAKKDKKKKDYVLSLIQKAKKSLSEAKKNTDKQSTKRGAVRALDDITKLVADLRKWAASDGK